MSNQFIVTAYLIYLPIALVLTWYVARTLFKNGLVFMRDIFFGREEIAVATNSLFKIGFYLLNVGFALYILKINGVLEGTQNTIEALSYKVGGFSIYLGVMLFLNLYLFFRGKRISKQKHEERMMIQRLEQQRGQA
ncbi:MAG: hypothetical protein EOP51_10290 [Sphingobacteriales bacterium]|nr:MAG: hypothetical protein EOP51_10290 [Sphingobacteriales bacterium]